MRQRQGLSPGHSKDTGPDERERPTGKYRRFRGETREGGVLEAKRRDSQGGGSNQWCQILSCLSRSRNAYIFCKAHSWLY